MHIILQPCPELSSGSDTRSILLTYLKRANYVVCETEGSHEQGGRGEGETVVAGEGNSRRNSNRDGKIKII
ncbi:uncharacterized protein LACBIDRAFT_305739 [Laccaria bicolor S238N-H82]|uniref:Predicted protein n=1 Tax=Laccaria bicolor (strain S238N-H82 / ATCC MYA-4686) TaxID=486041 RepID=B0CUX9_LACBS|nr:uncharacterized protein LACBIDRAFT_305739 [Laccaria bicolor S238N-H82]EDR14178.1 predicted protein [Laccaria bicolor S238N-H82]|eukprot:XP_001874737.1 predicted protein [Laccaria bicolor S238N-H82]